jgi:hypothetical protein
MVISVTSIKPERNSSFSLNRTTLTLYLLSSPFLSPILLLSICFHLLKEMNNHDCSLPIHFPIRMSFLLPSPMIVTWHFIFLGCMEWNCNIISIAWSCSMELQHRIHNIVIRHLSSSHNIVTCNKELQHKLQGRFATIFIHPN